MVTRALSFIWQLPQNILGLLVIILSKATKREDKVYVTNCRFGVSLGWYIIINNNQELNSMSIMHEKGHQRQSLYLGWLYLIIIGMPSFVLCAFTTLFLGFLSIEKRIRWYYWYLPWERWADYLGGVKRFA